MVAADITLNVLATTCTIDNSFVVPYNSYLSLRHESHVNLEIVHSVQAVKYLYIFQRAKTELHKDLQKFLLNQDAHYILESEAFGKTYGFPIHQNYPPVEKLPCQETG